MGASAHGIEVISRVLAELPAGFAAPILVVQHLGRTFPSILPEVLGRRSRLPVGWAEDRVLVEAGHVYVAPPDRHLLVRANELLLGDGPEENCSRPSIDVLFRSAALAYGPRVVGVVLSGYLRDGAAGLLAIKDRGGVTIVQDPDEAVAPEMPLAALAKTQIDYTCRAAQIAPLLIELVAGVPGAERGGSLDLERERRIAAADATERDLRELLDNGAPTPIVCPTCSAWLYRLGDGRLSRYRCRAGHAFTEACLIGGGSPTTQSRPLH
jgi:two-component system chemotaxis response regulator CheB